MKFTLWRIPLCALGALAATAILMPNDGPESAQPSMSAAQSDSAQQMPRSAQTASWQKVLASTSR